MAERMPAPFTAPSMAALKYPCEHCGSAALKWCRTFRGSPTERLHRARFVASGWCT